MKILFPLFNLPSAVSKSLDANLVGQQEKQCHHQQQEATTELLIMKALTDPTGQQE